MKRIAMLFLLFQCSCQTSPTVNVAPQQSKQFAEWSAAVERNNMLIREMFDHRAVVLEEANSIMDTLVQHQSDYWRCMTRKQGGEELSNEEIKAVRAYEFMLKTVPELLATAERIERECAVALSRQQSHIEMYERVLLAASNDKYAKLMYQAASSNNVALASQQLHRIEQRQVEDQRWREFSMHLYNTRVRNMLNP